MRSALVLSISFCLTLALPASAQKTTPRVSAFSQQFQQAYADYQAKKFANSAAALERLLAKRPNSFDVHELLGLVYAAQHKDKAAEEQMRAAVRLSPSAMSARNNLATLLIERDRPAEAEAEWRHALAVQSADYSANRNLARLYLSQGKIQEARPLLEAARAARPEDRDTAYDLAQAELMTGELAQARELTEQMLREKDSAEMHTLLGRIDEGQARYVDAANEFATAARMDPTEETLFAWAGELMAHRAYVAAIQVFEEGTRRFPASPRMWVGQGMALYSRGEYEPSIRALLKATDLNVDDPRCYLFLSKAYLSSPSQAEEVIERFRRYAERKPNDATAQFDYGISLWKGRRVNTPEIDYAKVESLLQRSIALDGTNAEVHLQLGILYNDEHAYERALPEFERAVQLAPAMGDAHFRLGRAYLRAGDKDKSDRELAIFKTLQAQHQAAVDKQRAEVQQFVVATETPAATAAGSQDRP